MWWLRLQGGGCDTHDNDYDDDDDDDDDYMM